MKNSAYVRFSITFLLVIAMLSPIAVLAGDGKKSFNEGLKYESSEEWDKAVEQFAKSVSENPKNPEYRLHLQRALFNASQMYMKKGTTAANQKDYVGAFNAFRAAYGYDPVNELAKAEMDRMVRLQQGIVDGDGKTNEKKNDDGVKLIPTGYSRQVLPSGVTIPQQLEKLRDVPFPSGVDLQFLIKELAKDLDLNVLFDQESRLDNRKVKIELKNVTAAKALDYIFLQENLFFQKVGPRTIIVANGNQRTKFQQLVLRTFYLANADPTEVAKVVQSAIPVQPGRTPTIPLIDKSTNSLTVRDTTENIKIIADLIRALDKDRAEVVMDVQIYEVTKNDLVQFGNQVGTAASLQNLGGSTQGVVQLGSGPNVFTAGSQLIRETFGVGLIIPPINLTALQNKQNTKLLASTQIHAFNNEDSSARIGQRVPVRTATFQTGTNTNSNGVVSDVINYEQVGLTLKFKPIVFPNYDVQVTMEIESKDVAGAQTLTPTFTERTIKGTARVQNNKTLLLASVAQNVESNGRSGLPLLGLIPILGRLFTAPTKDNRQVDIVIAITPRVIRAPSILPEDEAERPTGSLATPTSSSLEAMIIQEEIDEQLALARKVPTNVQVQLPDQKTDVPTYVKSNGDTSASITAPTENQTPLTETQTVSANTVATNLRPIDTGVQTLKIKPTVDSTDNNIFVQETSLKTDNKIAEADKTSAPSADLQILPTLSEMKAGEKAKLAVIVRSATAFRSAVFGLKFDQKKVAVRAVSFGDVFGKELAQTPVSPFVNANGRMDVSLFTSKDVAENSSGILAYIEIEALADGKPDITFDTDAISFLTADGKNFSVRF